MSKQNMNGNIIRRKAPQLCSLLLTFSVFSPTPSVAHAHGVSTNDLPATRVSPNLANASLPTETPSLAKPTETTMPPKANTQGKQSHLEIGTLALLALGMIALGLTRRKVRS